jgi:hypothetical protein
MSSDSFTARIRWQADADPAWELETSHGGFANPEQAALFANGFTNRAADELRLDDGRVCMTLTDGSTFELAAEIVQVWRLPEDCAEGEEHYPVADDWDFHRVAISFDELSALGLDGGFAQIKYGVVDPNGTGVDVAIALDATGLLTVTVNEKADETLQDASFALGIIPRT